MFICSSKKEHATCLHYLVLAWLLFEDLVEPRSMDACTFYSFIFYLLYVGGNGRLHFLHRRLAVSFGWLRLLPMVVPLGLTLRYGFIFMYTLILHFSCNK
jgi:hypothetical protein